MGDKIPVSAQDSTAELLTPLDLGSRPNGEAEVRLAGRHHRRGGRCWYRLSVLEKILLLVVVLLLLGCTALLLNLALVLSRERSMLERALSAGSVSKSSAVNSKPNSNSDPSPEPERCLTPTCLRVASRVLDRMDLTAEPCTDFYQYACGRYVRTHAVPSDAFSSSSLQQMQEQMLVDIKKLIEDHEVSENIPAIKKVEKLYYSCVNISKDPATDLELTRAVVGVELARLGGWPLIDPDWEADRFNLTDLITRLHSVKVYSLLEVHVNSDSRDTSTYIMQLFKGSPLIEEDYLLNKTDAHARRNLAAYRQLLKDTLAVLADPSSDTDQQAKEMIDFEIEFAKLLGQTSCEDSSVLLNTTDSDVQLAEQSRLTLHELTELTPYFDWSAMLQNFLAVNNISHDMRIVAVDCKPFVQAVSKFVNSSPKRVVANYLVWRFMFKNIRFMGQQLHEIWQDFRKQVPNLYEERVYSVRWKGCAELVEKGLGNVLSYMYIQHYDKHGIKAKVEEMIHHVKQAFRESLLSEDWIEADMKAALVKKLDMMGQKIAYPNSVLNITALNEELADLHFDDQHLLNNVLRLRNHEVLQDLQKLLRPVDKDRDWVVSPLQVNAFYSPMHNEILFPLGFLQEPFFGLDYPALANFANVGVVIGHELTHGFDNHGRRHNWGGNVTNWWSEKLLTDFTRRAMCIVKQYSKYKLDVVGKNVDGNKTVGENMCDGSGLKQAFNAWRMYRQGHPKEPSLPGLNMTDEKLFFVFYGQIWCEVVSREGWEKYAVDPHSPGRYRVSGVLQNSRQFAETFNCPVGSPMNPLEKCDVWT
ncbi:neprilysin-2-like isoform X2 [Amphibalanus amphitrite]|uniref:neprilysin-2-like isoform X2 n=1 Tax=Amphibalanus amphitrite TaxID=1232801 RepID=UPI001C91B03B|nr:neprilysin-2-like isoform X2 [Amphibalanus amphitrite]